MYHTVISHGAMACVISPSQVPEYSLRGAAVQDVDWRRLQWAYRMVQAVVPGRIGWYILWYLGV